MEEKGPMKYGLIFRAYFNEIHLLQSIPKGDHKGARYEQNQSSPSSLHPGLTHASTYCASLSRDVELTITLRFLTVRVFSYPKQSPLTSRLNQPFGAQRKEKDQNENHI